MAKIFEISSKQSKNGRRKFKVILHKIFPDDCVVDGIGTEFNDNGITWLEKHARNNLDSIKGMSIRCQFIDEERTELYGHGETDVKDGLAIFENAVVVGTCTEGIIEETIENNEIIKVCSAIGEFDEMCYKNFIDKLEKDMSEGSAPFGSVEIFKTEENSSIIYENGYHEKGRIPKDYIYSGYALLGVRPADNTAKLVELNNQYKEEITVDEKDLKDLIQKTISETNNKTEELTKTIAELNSTIAEKDNTISELNASVASIQAALDQLKKDHETYWEERNLLEQELAKVKVAQRLGELNEAISKFSSDEQKYAEVEINSFKEDALKGDIESIVSKICTGIVLKQKEDIKIAEQNSAKNSVEVEDIFSEINNLDGEKEEDINIF